MDRTADSPLAVMVVLALAAVCVWALLPTTTAVNVAPVGRVTEHARLHGSELENALWERSNGACVQTYRSPDYRRWIDVIGRPEEPYAYGLVRSAAGDVITGYHKPRLYWALRTIGWDLVSETGDCR